MPRHDEQSLYGPIPADQQLASWDDLIKRVAKPKDYAKIDFGKTERYLREIKIIPPASDGLILAPKYQTVEIIDYNDLWRKVGNKVLKYDDGHKYCRGIRWFKKLISTETHMKHSQVRDYFFGSPHNDKTVKMSSQEIEKELYKVLSMRSGKTTDAFEIMSRIQPGPFWVIPYSIDVGTSQLCPQTVLAGLPQNEFALPMYAVLCWIIMRMKMDNADGQKNFDVLTNEDGFRIDVLGDKHLRLNGQGQDVEENGLHVRWAANCLKLDTLPIDETADLRLAMGYLPIT